MKTRSVLAAALLVSTSINACDLKSGRFPGVGGSVVIALSLPQNDPEKLKATARAELAAAARNGAFARVIVARGTAPTAEVVRFSAEAGGGDLWPAGSNPYAWAESSRKKLEAAYRDIDKFFASITPSEVVHGAADPGGMMERALNDVAGLDGKGPKSAVVASNGVQHVGFDMYDVSFYGDANFVSQQARSTAANAKASDVAVSFVGVAELAADNDTIDPHVASMVTKFWAEVCSALQQASATSCRIRPFPTSEATS
jgi:hypothetical protein